MFDPQDWPELERPSVVLRHELGHAFVWYFYAGAIGTLRLFPHNGKVGGLVRVAGNAALSRTAPDWCDAEAERTLAGEIAARHYCGLRPGVSVGRGALRWRPTTALAAAQVDVTQWQFAVHVGEPDGVADIMKVLIWADDEHSHDWLPWIAQRQVSAQRIVTSNFDRIEAVAQRIESTTRFPKTSELTLAGFELLSLIRASGMLTHEGHSPVELRTARDKDAVWVRLQRWWNRRRSDAWPVQHG